jgi:hypothetical protein
MTPAAFRKMALSFPQAVEMPHFERRSFRVGTKIFATMTTDGREAMVPVRPLYRCFELLASKPDVFFSYRGWTQRLGSLGVHLALADPRLLKTLLQKAWARIAPDQKAPRRERKRSPPAKVRKPRRR